MLRRAVNNACMLKTLTAALSLFVAMAAFAFSGPEHVAISNLALSIAAREHPSALPLDELEQWTNHEQETFGDVVALVDRVKDAAPIFDTHAHRNPLRYGEIDWNHLRALHGQQLRSLQAKSLNENHFQSLALASHLSMHRAAIGEARGRPTVRALLFEAYALHHLQDFLSPGHVATARAGLADFVAIGLHDKYTARGLWFQFEKNERLIELAQFVAGNFTNAELQEAGLGFDAETFRTLGTAMERGTREHFLGDSHLHTKQLQAAFVTIITAASIAEVLGHGGDAFDGYCWEWGRSTTRCAEGPRNAKGMLHAAQIAGGGYDDVVRPLQFFLPGELLFVTLQNAVNPDRNTRGLERGAQVGERAVELETLVAAVPQAASIPFAPALLAGYARKVGPGPAGQSVHVRVIVPIPRTNLQLSGARYLDLERRSRSAYGVMLEAGFGFLFLRFGAQQNHNDVLGGRVNRSLVYTFGLSGIVPGRTVLHGAGSLFRN